MKKLMCIAITAFVFSCGRSAVKDKQADTVTDKILDSTCYVATDRNDTAYLKINAFESGDIKGLLAIHYFQSPASNGQLTGKFKGDTLFADYTYTTGTEKELHRNPLAFLRRQDSLVLGVGEIETMAGRSYFKLGTAIDFNKGRFRFKSHSCANFGGK